MDNPGADRNLLFGLLALQNGLIDQVRFVQEKDDGDGSPPAGSSRQQSLRILVMGFRGSRRSV